MSEVLLNTALFVGALLAMEPVAWLSHRFVMHGPLWRLHESHHQPRHGTFEKNDLFAVFFSVPSILLIYLGTYPYSPVLWAGLGVAAYGVCYFLFHDVLVHRRIEHGFRPRSGYLRRIVQAHRLHHASRSRTGGVSYGFLLAPPIERLRRRMRDLESRGHRFDAYRPASAAAGSHSADGSTGS